MAEQRYGEGVAKDVRGPFASYGLAASGVVSAYAAAKCSGLLFGCAETIDDLSPRVCVCRILQLLASNYSLGAGYGEQ